MKGIFTENKNLPKNLRFFAFRTPKKAPFWPKRPFITINCFFFSNRFQHIKWKVFWQRIGIHSKMCCNLRFDPPKRVFFFGLKDLFFANNCFFPIHRFQHIKWKVFSQRIRIHWERCSFFVFYPSKRHFLACKALFLTIFCSSNPKKGPFLTKKAFFYHTMFFSPIDSSISN